ncbi:MAG: hypothetical protein K2X82_27915 [Gemmataceae bacterium]|nr:hypothetical protein [Gemmataceae bacterium]
MKKQPPAPPDEGTAGRRLAAIARGVMGVLGTPPEFLRTAVRPVGGDHFRVNVLTGADSTSPRVAHSYFVTADDDGNLTASAPAIGKCY